MKRTDMRDKHGLKELLGMRRGASGSFGCRPTLADSVQRPFHRLVCILSLAIGLIGVFQPLKVLGQGNPTRTRVATLLVTIRPNGFEPSVVTQAQGPFLLAVENRSGRAQVDLRVDRLGGSNVRQAQVNRNQKLDWHVVLDLTPGDYVMTEVNHPTWICRITITPK